jgi:DNA-binding MarR family transcriptional regulator
MELEKEIAQTKFDSEYHKLVLNILFTGSWINARTVARLKPFDITPQQFNILRILRGQHPRPATLILLQQRMLDKMSDVSRLIERLRLRGLVARQLCEQNRRVVDILITDAGLALLKEIDQMDREWQKQFAALTKAEAKELNSLLDKLRG